MKEIKLLKAGCSHEFEFWIMRNTTCPVMSQPETTYYCRKCHLFETEKGFDPKNLIIPPDAHPKRI